MHRGEGFELDSPKGRDEMVAHHALVSLVGHGLDAALLRILKPPMQVVVEPEVLGVEGEATIPVSECPGQLVCDLFAGLIGSDLMVGRTLLGPQFTNTHLFTTEARGPNHSAPR